MAKIHVRGAAERRFPADQMEITVSVRASSVSSGEATRQGRAKTEQLLTLLQDRFGIPPEEVRLDSESIQSEYGVEERYSFRKAMRLRCKADLALSEALTQALEETESVGCDLSFDLSDRTAAEEEVIAAALEDARRKARLIAAATGAKLVGADEVRYEVYGAEPPEARMFKADTVALGGSALAARLSLPEITIDKELTVSFVCE